MAGLTSSGFTPKRHQEIVDSIKLKLAPYAGSGVGTAVESAIMQFMNPVAIEIAEGWSGTEMVYNSFNPNAAEQTALDNIGALTSTPRIAGAKSTVEVSIEGSEGSTITANFLRGVDTTNELFQTTQEYTLPAVGSQPLVITMVALNDGPVVAITGTLNQGALPSGITSMTNTADANVGTYDETDEEYRVGRVTRLAAFGKGTAAAVYTAVISVTGVTSVKILNNKTDVTDANGLPPHSFSVLVAGSFAHQDVIDAIGSTEGMVAGTYGGLSGVYADPITGDDYDVNYATSTLIPIYVDVTVNIVTAEFPTDGAAQIEAAILALEPTYELGEDVALPQIQAAIVSVPGISDYDVDFAKTASPSGTATIVIADTEQADFDSTRTNVVVP